MPIITDIELIERLAAEREDENWRFRTFLKGFGSEELDAIVHKIYANIVPQIDCQSCGNCCRVMHPIIKQPDIEKLSSRLVVSPDEFERRHLTKEDGDFLFHKCPCPFLSGNSCSVYESRPDDCRSYPHLHKEELIFRLIGVVQNYSVCPIVFNVFEQLKEELRQEDEFFDEDE